MVIMLYRNNVLVACLVNIYIFNFGANDMPPRHNDHPDVPRSPCFTALTMGRSQSARTVAVLVGRREDGIGLPVDACKVADQNSPVRYC